MPTLKFWDGSQWVPIVGLLEPPKSDITYVSFHALSFTTSVLSAALTLPAPPVDYPQTRPVGVFCTVLGGTIMSAQVVGWDTTNTALPIIQARRDDGATFNGTRELMILRVWNQ